MTPQHRYGTSCVAQGQRHQGVLVTRDKAVKIVEGVIVDDHCALYRCTVCGHSIVRRLPR